MLSISFSWLLLKLCRIPACINIKASIIRWVLEDHIEYLRSYNRPSLITLLRTKHFVKVAFGTPYLSCYGIALHFFFLLWCIWSQDLQVKSSPPVQTATPVHNDPAIIQVKKMTLVSCMSVHGSVRYYWFWGDKIMADLDIIMVLEQIYHGTSSTSSTASPPFQGRGPEVELQRKLCLARVAPLCNSHDKLKKRKLLI